MPEAREKLAVDAATVEDKERIASADGGRLVADVESAFSSIQPSGLRMAAHDRDGFPPEGRYTISRQNGNGNENHFQGIQRLGQYVFISGGDWKAPSSHLFVFELRSRSEDGRWDSNFNGGNVPEEDGLVGTIEIHAEMWHAGGLDTCGDILAVPVECHSPGIKDRMRGVKPPKCSRKKRSRIEFYYMGNPKAPKVLECVIERLDRKATAVALTRLPNQHYLAAVLSAKNKKQQRIDFYLSRSDAIWEGWKEPLELLFGKKQLPGYQAINFVQQDDEQRTLYMVGLHNTSGMAPADRSGINEAALYRVELGLSGAPPSLSAIPTVVKVGSTKRFDWGGKFYNMDAGGGVFYSQGELLVYSCYHYRSGGFVRFAQFAGPAGPMV